MLVVFINMQASFAVAISDFGLNLKQQTSVVLAPQNILATVNRCSNKRCHTHVGVLV